MSKKRKTRIEKCLASPEIYYSLLVFLMFLCVFLAYTTYQARAERWEMLQPRELVKYHENLFFYGDISDEGLQGHLDSLVYIPDWLVNHFYNAGGNVYLSDTMFFPQPNNIPERRAWGMFWAGNDVDAPEIWIYQDRYAKFISAHEFGHYLDFILGTASESEAFVELFEKEHEFFLRFYEERSVLSYSVLSNAFSTYDEYFAEFFAWYCLGHLNKNLYSTLIDKCPETHVYFDELLTKLEIIGNH